MNERTNEGAYEQANERANNRVNERTRERMKEQTNFFICTKVLGFRKTPWGFGILLGLN